MFSKLPFESLSAIRDLLTSKCRQHFNLGSSLTLRARVSQRVITNDIFNLAFSLEKNFFDSSTIHSTFTDISQPQNHTENLLLERLLILESESCIIKDQNQALIKQNQDLIQLNERRSAFQLLSTNTKKMMSQLSIVNDKLG